jgi:hypothetical protein
MKRCAQIAGVNLGPIFINHANREDWKLLIVLKGEEYILVMKLISILGRRTILGFMMIVEV